MKPELQLQIDDLRPSRIGSALRALFRTRITAGLLVVLPIYVTYLLVNFVFTLMRDASLWLIELFLVHYGHGWWGSLGFDYERLLELRRTSPQANLLTSNVLPPGAQWVIAIFAVLLTIFVLYAIGLFAANLLGARLIAVMETLLDRVPLVKTIYRATKQMLFAFSGDQSRTLQRVALIPFPSDDIRTVGFITNSFRDSRTGEELVSVFIPSTPNPTTAFLGVMPKERVTEVEWSVEEAFGAVMSGGLMMPSSISIARENSSADIPKA